MRFAILALALSLVVIPAMFAASGSAVPTADDPVVFLVGVSGMT